MMADHELRLTPASIGENTFRIPLYQRLFEWGAVPIRRLLDDLMDQYSRSQAREYYIGMLTSTSQGDLVDGQQRMIVLLLMGIAFKGCDGWAEFVSPGGKPRLTFTARPGDQEYLSHLIGGGDPDAPVDCRNAKMAAGLKTIREWIDVNLKTEEERKAFAAYVHEKLVFFVTRLPGWYKLESLNKYFERMNSTGKNLEGHEILKVRLLKKVPSGVQEFYTRAWNRVAEMDVPLFKVRSWRKGAEKETEERMKLRIQNVIGKLDDLETVFGEDLLNGVADQEESPEKWPSIREVPEREDAPKRTGRNVDGSRAVMSFSDFLLQVLYQFIEKKEVNLKVFFNKSVIVNTFETHLLDGCDEGRAEAFLQALIRYRILLDVYFVRIQGGQEEYDYDLETPYLANGEDVRRLKMLESMIYVDSSELTYYQWFSALISCTDRPSPVDADTLYQQLKAWDDGRHPKTELSRASLTFKTVNRYWFWRLDFQIWLNRKTVFSTDDGRLTDDKAKKALAVAENYVFKKNRSIEHIAPQTSQQNATLVLDKSDLNSFGNLVMISSEQNSSLSNSVYKEKKSRVEAFLDNSRGGSIESLKMLHAFTFNDTWSVDTVHDHGEEMYTLLEDSY